MVGPVCLSGHDDVEAVAPLVEQRSFEETTGIVVGLCQFWYCVNAQRLAGSCRRYPNPREPPRTPVNFRETLRVTVHGLVGDGPFFGRKTHSADKRPAENMDLLPFTRKAAAKGDSPL